MRVFPEALSGRALKRTGSEIWELLADAARQWSRDRAATFGAALAYYTLFSLGPLLVVIATFAGLVWGTEAARHDISVELKSLLGGSGAQGVESLLTAAGRTKE